MRTCLLSAIVVLLGSLLTACQDTATLDHYREGLHKVDAKIYADYLAYVSEAEQAGTRTPDTVWENRRLVDQAEKYYQTYGDLSKSLQGLQQPGTAPASPVFYPGIRYWHSAPLEPIDVPKAVQDGLKVVMESPHIWLVH